MCDQASNVERLWKTNQVRVVHLQTGEARLNLWGHRLVQMIDLVDHEHAIAISFERLPHNLLAISILIAGGGVNEVKASVEGAPYGGHELLQRELVVGKIANPQDSGHKIGAS